MVRGIAFMFEQTKRPERHNTTTPTKLEERGVEGRGWVGGWSG